MASTWPDVQIRHTELQYWDKMEKNHAHPLCLSHLLSVTTATKVTANTGINHLTGSCAGQDAFIVQQIFLSSCPDVKVQIQASCLQCESAHYFFMKTVNYISQNAQRSHWRIALLKCNIRKDLIINQEVSRTGSLPFLMKVHELGHIINHVDSAHLTGGICFTTKIKKTVAV